ncbi:MAG: BamA/TamA family outer membrane protein [Steroidobacteraceae bacterium]
MTEFLSCKRVVWLALCLGTARLATAQEKQAEAATEAADNAAAPGATDAASIESSTEAPLTEVTTTAIPTDAQLQASGAVIGRIDIKVVDVFDTDNPKESGKAYRAANYLHINTREQTVRPQLLFKSGEPYMRHILDETERNLRARRYLEDASILPVAYHADTNTVDLLVRVHDVWTLNPGATLGRSGGANHTGIQLDESNLLGLGKSISVDRDQDVDRSAWKFGYRDPNFLSTRWELGLRYYDNSDGHLRGVNINHPFYSLDTRWSAALDASSEERIDKRFEQAQVVDQYVVRQKSAGVQAGWSTGLRTYRGSGWVQRWSLGYRDDAQRFSPDPVLGTLTLPVDKVWRYPWVGLSWFQDKYEVTRNRDRIARTEDVYVGLSLNTTLGYAAESWGSTANALIASIQLADTYRLSERQYLSGNLSFGGRHQSDAWHAALYSGSLRYDFRETNKALFVISLSHAHLENPDDSQQLYLGSDEGMRGYVLRFRSGTERSVLALEQRVYTDKQILRLLSVGGAAFIDVGHIAGETFDAPNGRSTFADVGFGLRLGNIRSSRGDIFHLDLAYPLNADDKDRKLQFSVTTKTSF